MKLLAKTLLLVIVLQACTETKESRISSLPESGGELAEIVVISDNKTLDSSYKVLIKKVFGKEIEGYPPPYEPTFKVLTTDETFFRGYFKTHHNIIVLLTGDNLEEMKGIYGEVNTQKIKDIIGNSEALGLKQKELWAQNQNVFYVTAPTKEAMETKLSERSNELLEVALSHERLSGKRKLFTNSSKRDSFYVKTLRENGYAIRKPASYRVAMDEPKFKWLRKSPASKELEFDIILFESPYTNENQLHTDSLLAVRNKFTKKYIPGEYDGSYMKYSDVIIPNRKQVNYKNKYSIELKGWWDMHGDYMGGPSFIKAIVDHKKGRIVYVEGFLFHPNEKKAKQMRELEMIMNTVVLD
ncbi:MAG: DUF4837 family protein, partial [Bacteroidia bacterium]|nr:DUF4837 family protein [Bacteroidia bacterium]